jgi:hypothetical protein
MSRREGEWTDETRTLDRPRRTRSPLGEGEWTDETHTLHGRSRSPSPADWSPSERRECDAPECRRSMSRGFGLRCARCGRRFCVKCWAVCDRPAGCKYCVAGPDQIIRDEDVLVYLLGKTGLTMEAAMAEMHARDTPAAPPATGK